MSISEIRIAHAKRQGSLNRLTQAYSGAAAKFTDTLAAFLVAHDALTDLRLKLFCGYGDLLGDGKPIAPTEEALSQALGREVLRIFGSAENPALTTLAALDLREVVLPNKHCTLSGAIHSHIVALNQAMTELLTMQETGAVLKESKTITAAAISAEGL